MRVPSYTIKHSAKAKHIRLKVTPQDGLAVVVPSGYDAAQIPALLHRKKEWIAEKLTEAADKRRFFEPEPVLHLPQHLPLRALREDWKVVYRELASKAGVGIQVAERELILTAAAFERSAVINKLKEWLRGKVRECLFPLTNAHALKGGFRINNLMVKSQRTRWASCSSQKNLTLNTKLLFLAPDLVRYVIIHELCHTVHMNHSGEFWRLVACHEPAYKVLDQQLREAWKGIPHWAH